MRQTRGLSSANPRQVLWVFALPVYTQPGSVGRAALLEF
jgi:hypothetical protein